MVRQSFEAHQAVVAASLDVVVGALEQAIDLTIERLGAGSQVLVFGNGGSAAQAQHFATELTCRFAFDRQAWPAIALSADAVTLTAIGNDHGYEQVFARQVEALARPGDVVVAISTSGRSANVLVAAAAARERGCHVVALTGQDGPLAELADVAVAVPSGDVARIQEVHAICLHAWAGGVEQALGVAEVDEHRP